MTEPRQLPPEFRRRRPWPTTEMQRVLATEHHSTRGLLLRVAEDAPHPTGRAAAAVVAGARRKRARSDAGVRVVTSARPWWGFGQAELRMGFL